MKISSTEVLREYIKKNNLNYLIRSKEIGDCVELEFRKIINRKNGTERISNQPSIVKINKNINIDSTFVEWLGLWYGDGFRLRIGISNNELSLVKFYLDFIEEYIGFSRENFTLSIYVNSKDRNTIKREEILKQLNLPEKCFRNIYTDERCTKPIFYIEKFNIGMILLIRSIFDYLLSFLHSNKSFTVAFLKGVFAAEGSVYIKKQKSGAIKRAASIGCIGKTKIFYDKLLKWIGIKTVYKDKRSVSVSNHRDLIKMNKLGIPFLHPVKHKKFCKMIAGYKKFPRRKGETKQSTIDFLRKMGCAKTNEIAKQINFTNKSAYEYLKQLKNKEIIKHLKIFNSWFWLLTDIDPKDAFRKRLRRKYQPIIEAFKKLGCASPHDVRKFLRNDGIEIWDQIYHIVDWLVEADLLKLVKEETLRRGAITVKRFYSVK